MVVPSSCLPGSVRGTRAPIYSGKFDRGFFGFSLISGCAIPIQITCVKITPDWTSGMPLGCLFYKFLMSEVNGVLDSIVELV